MRENKGYFLIFSTDAASTPSEILDHYRAKDADEKLFAQVKVDMEGRRMRTHNEAATDGKTFVSFIACLIRACLLRRLSKYLSDNSTSLKKAFCQLSNITISDFCKVTKQALRMGRRLRRTRRSRLPQLLRRSKSEMRVKAPKRLAETMGISLDFFNNLDKIPPMGIECF
ncbi:MAG: hypothetical protein LBT00_09410 [Spirochaetaceae bacterium]|jgi:hypothetical protein|nr:hypothetical protein [Spirochaetaceae bacterium]